MRLFRHGITGSHRTFFLSIAIASAITGLFLYQGASPFIQQIDLRLKDARQSCAKPHHPSAPVSIIAIDNKSIKELGRWPWPREVTARLIEATARQGARVIALDMVFSEPQDEKNDRALSMSISTAGSVVMGYFFRDEQQPQAQEALAQLRQSRVSLLRISPGATIAPLPAYDQVEVNIPSTLSGAAGFGYFNQISDADGQLRSIPLLMGFRGDVYPTLALTAVSHFRNAMLQVDMEPFGVSRIVIGMGAIPASEQGKLALAFYGPGGTVHTVSAADVIAGRLPTGTLSGHLVFIGVTEPGIADMRTTPVDPSFSGVELHATAAANILEQRFITRNSWVLATEIAAILLLPLIMMLFLTAVPGAVYGLTALATIAAGYIGTNFTLFNVHHYDLSIICPLLPLAISYLGGECYRSLVVERKGRHLKKAFSTYLSADLVAEIAKNPDFLKLGGEKRTISILFSDIRGFTYLSEKLAPEELVALLNRYLSPMTRIVLEERGTLDKFVGDAIMAFFNAPLDVPDHPRHACRTAIRMLDALASLNTQLASSSIPAITIGIGIHTGEAVVGNMGADVRFDYTAIGDSVNLASRLEGLTKQYGVPVLVSEETRRQANDEFCFREVDLVRVKGKQKPVAVFELRPKHQPAPDSFVEGIRLYRNRDFAKALELFETLARCNDPVSTLYVERCQIFLQHPPEVHWDGVYVATAK